MPEQTYGMVQPGMVRIGAQIMRQNDAESAEIIKRQADCGFCFKSSIISELMLVNYLNYVLTL